MTADLTARDAEVRQWMADPHRYFKAFSRVARRFQHEHRSARYRVMTFVGTAEDFLPRRPLRVALLGQTLPADSWEAVLADVVSVIASTNGPLIQALSRAGLVPWMANGAPELDLLEAFRQGKVTLQLDSVEAAFRATQWLLLMAGIRLNEAVVQVDPFTDETWRAREADLRAKRTEEARVLREIDLARKQYAETHPEDSADDVTARLPNGGPIW